MQQSSLTNRLLRSLSREDFELLRPGLSSRSFDAQEVLWTASQRIDFACFPETGIASITTGTSGHLVDLGPVGREGMLGVSVLLDSEVSISTACVQVSGEFVRIPRPVLLNAMEHSSTLRKVLLCYARIRLTQVSQNLRAVVNLDCEGRLARYLLMCHDRLDGDEVPLTNEGLALMIGVRQPAVTLATHVLQADGAIRAGRGRITVLSRDKLVRTAQQMYGQTEQEYERLLGTAAAS